MARELLPVTMARRCCRQVDSGSTVSRAIGVLQLGWLHRWMLADYKVLINGRHTAVLSKLLHYPLCMITTSMKTLEHKLSQDYRFWNNNFIAKYLRNTTRKINHWVNQWKQQRTYTVISNQYSNHCLTLSAAAVCHSLDTCNAPTPHRTIAVLYKPALWVLPMIGDGGLAVPDNPGWEQWRLTYSQWTSDHRHQSGVLRTDRHGGNSWQWPRLRQAPEEEKKNQYLRLWLLSTGICQASSWFCRWEIQS